MSVCHNVGIAHSFLTEPQGCGAVFAMGDGAVLSCVCDERHCLVVPTWGNCALVGGPHNDCLSTSRSPALVRFFVVASIVCHSNSRHINRARMQCTLSGIPTKSKEEEIKPICVHQQKHQGCHFNLKHKHPKSPVQPVAFELN